MTRYHSTFSTPFGKFSVAVDDAGAIVATAFGGPSALAARDSKCRSVSDDRANRRGATAD